jgi:multiple sugar transport system substrate-binding protein
MKRVFVLLLTAALFSMISACGGGTESAGEVTLNPVEPTVDESPVTVTFFILSAALKMEDNEFKAWVADPVKKKYPNITMQYMVADKGTSVESMIGAGTVPDIVWAAPGAFIQVKELNLFTDLSQFIKKYKFDMGRLESAVTDSVKSYGKQGEILYLPSYIKSAALYYNKDIFDKFAVDYPKDGMTWDQTLELAKKVSRTDGGVQYQGFGFNVGFMMQNNQLSAPFVDPKTNKALLDSDKWKTWFNTMKGFYENGNIVGDTNNFFKDKTLAMFADQNIISTLVDPANITLNWDMVTLPSFKEAPGVGIQLNSPGYFITPSSKVKDQAFQAISVLLSDESQATQARLGRDSVLKDPAIKKQLGNDLSMLRNKNTAAFYKNKIASTPDITLYDGTARTVLGAKFNAVTSGQTDVNTALREAAEEATQKIEAQK